MARIKCTQPPFRNQMSDLQNINPFHQLSRCSKTTTKTNSCLRHPLLPEQKADAEHASIELADKTNYVKTISRSLVCTVTNWEPQNRRREELSLASLSLGCEIYKRHLSFSLLPSSQATFSSSKCQILSAKEPCDKEKTQNPHTMIVWPSRFDFPTKITQKKSLPL